MKWLFLSFFVALAALGNYALLEELTLRRGLGALAFSGFCAALVGFWWASYFTDRAGRGRTIVASHAVLMLTAGCGLAILGGTVLANGSCQTLISSGPVPGLLSTLGTYAQATGICRPLGLVLFVGGIYLALPSCRLFLALAGMKGAR
ncbi:MAG TPA: hypothetical protein VIL30_21380 [Ramlibacter sp.]|jgi:apolipoprotein N-acyltransferase